MKVPENSQPLKLSIISFFFFNPFASTKIRRLAGWPVSELKSFFSLFIPMWMPVKFDTGKFLAAAGHGLRGKLSIVALCGEYVCMFPYFESDMLVIADGMIVGYAGCLCIYLTVIVISRYA